MNSHRRLGHVLIVEDDPGFRAATKRLLTGQGYSITTAASAEEATSVLDDDSLTAVLLDLHLPGTPGMSVLQTVASRRPELPVVILSGGGTMEDAIEALRHRAVDYLRKPVRPPDLFGALERAQRKWPHPSAPRTPPSPPPTQRQGVEAVVERLLQRVVAGEVEVPTLDPRALRIHELARQPTSGIREVLELMGRDPRLVAAVLARANTGFFRADRIIKSLREACVLLGNRQVFSLCFEALVLNTFEVRSPVMRDLWGRMRRNTAITAEIARRIAKLVGAPHPEDAFVLALLHNLGEVVLVQLVGELVDAGEVALDLGELAVVTADWHERFGAALATAWGLPVAFGRFMGCHHEMGEQASADDVAMHHLLMGSYTYALELGLTYFPQQHSLDASWHFAMLGLDTRDAIRACDGVTKLV